MSEISIVVPTCSPRVPLRECLNSLLNQTLDRSRYEILLVNNGGKRHREKFIDPVVNEVGGGIRVLDPCRNLGYSGGCRYGAGQAQGDLLLFHNDDALADPAWLALALAEFRTTPDLGVVTCRVVDATGPRIQHEGVTLTLPNGLFWQTGWGEADRPGPVSRRNKWYGSLASTFGDAPGAIDLEYFSGCVWGTPKRVWEEVGGLSPLFHPGYYEDTEYGLRCRQLGYRIRLLSTVTCSHYGSLTLGSTSRAYWIAFHRSRFLFLVRNRTGYGVREILKAEWRWWTEVHADSHAVSCLLGWVSSLPRMPRAIRDRYRFRNKCLLVC